LVTYFNWTSCWDLLCSLLFGWSLLVAHLVGSPHVFFFLVYHLILILSLVKNHNQNLTKNFWMTIIEPLNHCIRYNILKRISSKFKVISNAFVWHEYTSVTKRKGNTNAKTIDKKLCDYLTSIELHTRTKQKPKDMNVTLFVDSTIVLCISWDVINGIFSTLYVMVLYHMLNRLTKLRLWKYITLGPSLTKGATNCVNNA